MSPFLLEPVPGDHGAHGPFDAEAWHFSPQLWANKNRNWLLAGLSVIGAACAFAAARSRNGNERRSVFAASQVSG